MPSNAKAAASALHTLILNLGLRRDAAQHSLLGPVSSAQSLRPSLFGPVSSAQFPRRSRLAVRQSCYIFSSIRCADGKVPADSPLPHSNIRSRR